MGWTPGWLSDPAQHALWLMMLYATALRATVLVAAAGAAAWALRRGPAATRSLVWGLALLGVLVLPFMRVLPVVHGTSWTADVLPGGMGTAYLALVEVQAALPAARSAAPIHWVTALFAVWATGALWVVLGLVRGWRQVRRAAAGAAPVTDPVWLDLLRRAAERLGVHQPVTLLRHAAGTTPLTWGVRRPAVLLPADADEWPEAHREAVLLHELAHVRRLDWLLQVLAHTACAIFWFHPGVWWMLQRLRVDREYACDDRALGAGARAADYAECLMSIADRVRAQSAIPSMAVSVGMARLARPSRLRERLLAVLDARRARRLSPTRAGLVMAGALAVFLPVGTSRIGPRAETLVAALGHARWETRASAAALLGSYPADQSSRLAVEALARAVAADPSDAVRHRAGFALYRMHQARPDDLRAWGIAVPVHPPDRR